MTLAGVAGSFRDPSGFVFTRDGVIHRQVNMIYREEYDLLRSCGLYDALVERGLLIPHAEVDVAAAPAPGAYKVLRPEPLDFVAYPYEWCFSQLKDAALTTLDIQDLALEHGMSLRDASAFNIQFHRGSAVFIDTLSFEAAPQGRPWVAYRQFCQHFLAPLALMSLVDVRLGQLSRVHLDGVPLDLASALLPRTTRLRPGLLMHLHAHAKSQSRHAGDVASAQKARTGEVSDRALRGLVDNLRSTVRRLDWQPRETEWVDYYEGDSYSDASFEHKTALVTKFVEQVAPRTAWDLGANTGRHSQIASDAGAFTVAFDIDPGAVEAGYRQMKADGQQRLLPLVLDLTNPSPAIGWHNSERGSVPERGPVDLIMALALVHHLAISNNVPLERIARFLAELGPSLIIEFVPKSDPKVQVLLASRADIFPDYHLDGFEAAMSTRFTVEQSEPIRGTDRTLFLLRRR
ncbi:MAG: SAM-dependent methyltransferase [Nitriliruptorales bacterium]|nr:SAM-dependent methyltransferase [Nitriliruptorales bacterium]